jgi:hypothetical protein
MEHEDVSSDQSQPPDPSNEHIERQVRDLSISLLTRGIVDPADGTSQFSKLPDLIRAAMIEGCSKVMVDQARLFIGEAVSLLEFKKFVKDLDHG